MPDIDSINVTSMSVDVGCVRLCVTGCYLLQFGIRIDHGASNQVPVVVRTTQS